MIAEDRLLYLCCRQDFEAQHGREVSEICSHQLNWDGLVALAEHHGVAPLVHYHLNRLPEAGRAIPDAARLSLKQSYFYSVFKRKQAGELLGRALELCAAHGQVPLLIKGAALGLLVYREAWFTLALDIDLALPFREVEVKSRQLQPLVDALEELNQRRVPFQMHLEYDFFAHHDLTMNAVIPVDVARLWKDARVVQLEGGPVLLPAAEDILIVAAIGACRKRYLRLKALFDLAECTYHLEDLDWGRVVEKAGAYRCAAICYTALRVADRTLGCRVPETAWDGFAISKPRRRLIDRLVDWLLEHRSLAQLSATGGRSSILGRAVTFPLILTYLSYTPFQVIKKMSEILQYRRAG